jgi:hypothetical protein
LLLPFLELEQGVEASDGRHVGSSKVRHLAPGGHGVAATGADAGGLYHG